LHNTHTVTPSFIVYRFTRVCVTAGTYDKPVTTVDNAFFQLQQLYFYGK